MIENNLETFENVPRKAKFSLALGGFANGLLSGLPFANLTFFYEEKLGLNSRLVGLAWLIFAIWNTVNDPLFSYIIDNTRTRIGRRIPYIRYGSVFYGACFIFCWFPIASPNNQIGLFFNLLIALFLIDTAFTFIGCCFFSLPNEMAVTAKQRASITIYSSAFMFLNLAIGLGLPIFLLTGQEGIHPLFKPIMVFLGVACTIILFVTSYGIKENMFAQEQPHEGFIEGLRKTLKNKPFWIIMIPAFCLSLIIPLIQTGILYYIEYVLAGQDIKWFLFAFVIFVILGIGVNIRILDKWYVKKTSILTYILFTLAFILTFVLGYNAWLAIIPFSLFGFSFGGGLLVNAVLMGDCIDNDELITGERREAIYGGVNAIVTKPGISIANAVFLELIMAFGFIRPEIVNGVAIPQSQPMIAKIGIMFALCIIPAIGTAISAIALHWYPLDGQEWLMKKKFILELHEKKEKEYLKKLRQGLMNKNQSELKR
ncbi:MAG: MFS transporter [Promethearchaeota archaeon]